MMVLPVDKTGNGRDRPSVQLPAVDRAGIAVTPSIQEWVRVTLAGR